MAITEGGNLTTGNTVESITWADIHSDDLVEWVRELAWGPGGMLDTSEVSFDPVSDRAVKVSGMRWVPAAQYTVKLEGVERDGYRAITNAGVHGMQEVPHYHLHILGGRVLGRLVGITSRRYFSAASLQ